MKKRLVISFVVVLIVALCTWLLLRWANAPVKQRVISTDVSAQTTTDETITVATDYYTTKLPANYRVEIDPNPSNPTMIQLSAFPSDNGEVQVGITTTILPPDGLDGIADYLYRVRQADTYSATPSTSFSSDSYAFRKTAGGELTTFVLHNHRYASITVSGQGIDDNDLETIQQLIAVNWQWL